MNCNKRQRGPRNDERKKLEENHLKNMTCSEARELYILSIGKRSVNERVRDELEKAMWGLPCGSNAKSICLRCRRPRFDTLEKVPGEFHGQRSLASYNPRGHKESVLSD